MEPRPELPPIIVSAQGVTSTVLVRPGLLATIGQELRVRSGSAKALLVTDSVVGPLHAGPLLASLGAAGFTVITHTLPAGEQHKHLETLLPAYSAFLSANIDRQTPLLSLGGGVTGDMAGFLAATLLRGLPFVQVPTTLLAMVDASIGGKTGVNHVSGKNLIGAFHQPVLVAADAEVLATLPDAEVSNGLAECIKHDAIRDPSHFARLVEVIPSVRARDLRSLTDLVHHNAAIKAAVVNEDPLERGVRAHLNFGHTFAHAIESATDHAIAHGAAVGLGLVAAGWLSNAVGLLSAADRDRLTATVAIAGLPTEGLRADPGLMLAAMRRDKKVEQGHLRFILLNGLGKPVIRNDIPESLVLDALRQLAC